jgi:hypothetical protein
MKPLSEKQALAKLRNLKNHFRAHVRENYEHRAKNCRRAKRKARAASTRISSMFTSRNWKPF